MDKQVKSVAIIGAGPSGCALGCFLIERGIAVTIYDNLSKPELIVGESNLPAVVPIFRRLGIEEKVAAISQIKRGASFRHGSGIRMDIPFQTPGKHYPNFSYNTPRPQLDSLIRQRAEEVGVRFVNKKATLELAPENSERDLILSEVSLNDAGLSTETHPDILIDASGRSRLFSRLLDIPAKRGGRDDIAYFAHFENFEYKEVIEGQIVVSILDHGWSWQIPLKGRLSVGVVLNKQAAKSYGETPEERLDNVIKHNSLLKDEGKNAKRISKVMRYSNYQLLSEKGYGKGWVMLGDAFGFVDPMLSPGVFMALNAAQSIDEIVFSSPKITSANLEKYSQQVNSWHQSWTTLIDYFYDGRLMSLSEQGKSIQENPKSSVVGKMAEKLYSRIISSMVTGIKTRSKVNQSLLYHGCRQLLKDQEVLNGYAVKPFIKKEQNSH
ncbi:NAD(P)/FAD-dependent oxidoreductase [uncultured Cocleimonas sp.]|uniref:NAD(P)/FAD-dependent oxidoreductase n=1 Tax=uncultured Cocleimonas sp. TaxID=1051587 RepID=UPI00261DDAA1|nr:NAD(P)/FAD-dependent oxidoreductase [uncultured Cocleimonas sp.]